MRDRVRERRSRCSASLAIVCAARPLVAAAAAVAARRAGGSCSRALPRSRVYAGVLVAASCRRARRRRPRARCAPRALPPITIDAVARRQIAARPARRRDASRTTSLKVVPGARRRPIALRSGSSPARARTRRSRSPQLAGAGRTDARPAGDAATRWSLGRRRRSGARPQPPRQRAGALAGYPPHERRAPGRPRLPQGAFRFGDRRTTRRR